MELLAAGRAFRLISLALLAALVTFLVSCARTADSPGVDATPTERPAISDNDAEDAIGAAEAFLAAAAAKNYWRM